MQMRLLAASTALCVLLLAFGAGALAYQQPEAPTAAAPKTLVTAKRQMVVAANPLGAEAGLAILRKGGSAVDAAIATQMVLNVVEPQSSGIGGGLFLLAFDAGTKNSDQHRRARDGSGRRDAGPVPRRRRQATSLPEGRGERDSRSACLACSPR